MADAAARSQAICRDYIAELKAVGICPAEADADGRLPTRDRATGDWDTHYQAARYRSGRYLDRQRRLVADRRRLAGLLGVADPDRLFTPYCAQCGRNTTVTTAVSDRDIAYACRDCGAHVRTGDLSELKPAWAVDWMLRVWAEGIDCEPAGHDHCVAGSTMDRTRPVFDAMGGRPQPVIVPYGLVRQFGDAGKVSGSRGGGLRLADLLAVLPARLVLWLYARPDVRADMRIGLDLASIAGLYAAYDRFVVAAAGGERRALALWRLLTDDDRPAARGAAVVPGFRRVAGAVQSHLGDLPAAEAALLRAGDRGAVPAAELRERLVLARSWLATWGRGHCWLPTTCAGPAGVTADLDVLADQVLAGAYRRQIVSARDDESDDRRPTEVPNRALGPGDGDVAGTGDRARTPANGHGAQDRDRVLVGALAAPSVAHPHRLSATTDTTGTTGTTTAAAGPTGGDGRARIPGATDVAGATGTTTAAAGPTGGDGRAGIPGATDVAGATCAAGTTGNAGTAGASDTGGLVGSRRASGANARNHGHGTTGTNGSARTVGTNGCAGANGSAGTGGTIGTAGSNGSAGTSDTRGATTHDAAHSAEPSAPMTAADMHDVAFALWGTTTAPPLSRVVERCGADAVAEALRAYRHDGSRPLRRLVERRLGDGEEPRWA